MKQEKQFLVMKNQPYCSRPKHQGEKIIRVCTNPECADTDRLLCGHCIVFHASHPAKLIPINEFLAKSHQRHTEINLFNLSENSCEEKLIRKIEEMFSSVRETFYQFLMEEQVKLISKYRDTLGFSSDFNLGLLNEISGKNISSLTKSEWNLLINMYWKDDIDNAIYVKDETIKAVMESIEPNFTTIQNTASQHMKTIKLEVDNMIRVAEKEVIEKDAPINLNNLDQWNKNYEIKQMIAHKKENILKIEDEIMILQQNTQQQKENVEMIQMDILQHENKLKQLNDKEHFIKSTLDQLNNNDKSSSILYQLKAELEDLQKQIELVTHHSKQYEQEMNANLDNLKSKQIEAENKGDMEIAENYKDEFLKLEKNCTKTKKQLKRERGNLLIQREDLQQNLAKIQQQHVQNIENNVKDKHSIVDEKIKLEQSFNMLKKKLIQAESLLRDNRAELKRKDWMVMQEKAEIEQQSRSLNQNTNNTNQNFSQQSKPISTPCRSSQKKSFLDESKQSMIRRDKYQQLQSVESSMQQNQTIFSYAQQQQSEQSRV